MKLQLVSILADLLSLPESEINDSLTMQNTESWDSLKHMELIVTIEQNFGIELSFEEIVAMQSFTQINNILTSHGLAA